MPRKPLYWSLSTRRIKLVVSYDGTDFCGWAPQAGQRTVQSTLKQAVRRVSGEDCEIAGASRTDAGAHALGQVCHFDSSVAIKVEDWPRILNRVLPCDVGVLSARRVPEAFHSRQTALSREYRYRILLGQRDPIRGRFAYQHGRDVELEAMRSVATAMVGENDFRAFSEEVEADAPTFRRVYEVRVRSVRDEIWIEVVGNAFLRGMMRRIAGGLLEVGLEHRRLEDFKGLLSPETRDEIRWPVVLPAKGLTLMKVRYGRRMGDNSIHGSKSSTNESDQHRTAQDGNTDE